MSLVKAQREEDEQLLLRRLRCLHDCARSSVLKHVAETLAARVSADPHLRRYSEPAAETIKEELESSLDSRLRCSMPPEEPWHYLGDWMDDTISSAWGDETAAVIFGACAYDKAN